MWQHSIVLHETWIARFCPFLWEKPPEEEYDKNYGDEEVVKKWNYIKIKDAKVKEWKL